MKAIIMAGGEGTRLRPLTNTIPKPLIPVCGRPCITYALDMLCEAGIGEAAITLRYRADDIIAALGDSYKEIKLTYFIEKEPLGTAGGVAACREFFADSDTFVVTSGDSVCSLDLEKAIECHYEHSAVATLLLVRSENVLEYGVVMTANDGSVVRFIEKPDWGQAFSDTVNTGTYIFDSGILDRIPENVSYDFGRDLFPALQREGVPIFSYECIGDWCDIGDPESLLRCTLSMQGDSFIDKSSIVAPGTMIFGSVIMDRCDIGRGSTIEHSIIAPGSCIPAGTTVRDAIWQDGISYPIKRDEDGFSFGLALASISDTGRIAVAGPHREEIIRGIIAGGKDVRDLGDADARLCAFAAREYRLDHTIYAGTEYLIFDRMGLGASRKFLRSIKEGKESKRKGKIILLEGLKSRYISALARSIERIDRTRFYTKNTLLRLALEKQGGIYDPESDLIIDEKGLCGLDLWHMCAIIISNSNIKEIAIPYIAPAALFRRAGSLGIKVCGYALSPSDDSESDIRALAAQKQWMCDSYFAAATVISIIAEKHVTLSELIASLPPFFTAERNLDTDKRGRLKTMKRFGTPDGEGVIKNYPTGQVRAIAKKTGLSLIAEAASFEAADELLTLSSDEIKKLIK